MSTETIFVALSRESLSKQYHSNKILKCVGTQGVSHAVRIPVLPLSFELAKMMVEWREGFFPLNDQEEEMRAMLDKGVMFWVGRDQSLRPLLVIK